jgi:hypothetical protein
LFRSLKTGTRPPKHGIIFQHPLLHEAKKWQRGKIARALAGKLAIAARTDVFGGRYIGEELRADLEKRVEEIRQKYAEPPKAPEKSPNAKRSGGRRNMHVRQHPQFPQVYIVTLDDGSQKLATMNLAPGRTVYGEKLIKFEGVEYRLWDPFRSKLAAAILKGIKAVPIKPDHQVLYLGAASGTTASHVSDIVGEKGHVYCVEFAARALRELVNNVCPYRLNMTPILEDARFPERYAILSVGRWTTFTAT